MMSYKRWVITANAAIRVLAGEQLSYHRLELQLRQALERYVRYEGDLVCPLCGFKAKTRYALKLHIRRSHKELLDAIVRELNASFSTPHTRN